LDTTPKVGGASFVPEWSLKMPTVPTKYRLSNIKYVYANPKRIRAIIIAINISLYSFIILKSPISFNGEALYLKIFDIEEGNHQEVVEG